MLERLIWLVGVYHVAKFVINFAWECFKQIVPQPNLLRKYGGTEKWAVVTGGTDGIGLGFCEELVEMGWNIFIISRNENKILRTIEQLKQNCTKKRKNSPQIKYIVADFKNSSEPYFIDGIVAQLNDVQIGLLVNNVGTSDTKNIDQFSNTQIIDIINVNCVSMATLTARLIPVLKRQNKSAIINLSSFLGETCAPYVSLYSATKAFNTFFSESVSMENCAKGIDILSVRPMFVESPLSKAKKSFTVPDRRQCARACLRELKWTYETHGYFIHRILALLANLAPKSINRLVTSKQSYKQMIKYRNK